MESCLAWQKVDLLVEETSTRTFTRDQYKASEKKSPQTPELAEVLAFRKWT